MMFATDYNQILEQIRQIEPLRYAQSRNYTDGAVSRLSPYISRGLINTRLVFDMLTEAGHRPGHMEKFVQELAWRDYWQFLWNSYGDAINRDLRRTLNGAVNTGVPEAVRFAKTGITAIDKGIESLYATGYMHNHVRMYVASVCCNIARCHWRVPAQWMYYHLLDADWGSNALSWQWVSGAGSSKLYYANQENINRYAHTQQSGTFLDLTYEELPHMNVPEVLQSRLQPALHTPLPETALPLLDTELPTLVYNFYNLDPQWRKEMAANRILLLEPSVFKQYPVSQNSIDFCTALAMRNIPGIQIMVAEFSELDALAKGKIYYREHPLNRYTGIADPRMTLGNVQGEFKSFFAYWKALQKTLFQHEKI